MNYIEIPAEHVPWRKRVLAEKACRDSCVELRLPEISIRWFRPTYASAVNIERLMAKLERREATAFKTDAPICGQMKNLHPFDIYVSADLSTEETIRSVRHENYHHFQLRTHGLWWPSQNPERAEREARAYEAQA